MARSIKTLLILLFVFIFSCNNGEDTPKEKIEAGDNLPRFTIMDTTGTEFDSQSLIGKHSLIIFFEISCPYCRAELPLINELWDMIKDDPGYALLLIERKQEDGLAQYWTDNGLTVPVYVDRDRAVYSLFASSVIPRHYIVSPQSKITWIQVGSLDENTTASDLKDMMSR